MRITRHQMYREILEVIKKRSTCERKQVASIIVKDGRIISMGYAGSPSGTPHCQDEGCIIGPNGGCIRTVHAEANAIAFAARAGISTEGSMMYVTLSPCIDCAKLIINSGIKGVIFFERYRDDSGIKLLENAGIECIDMEDKNEETN